MKFNVEIMEMRNEKNGCMKDCFKLKIQTG